MIAAPGVVGSSSGTMSTLWEKKFRVLPKGALCKPGALCNMRYLSETHTKLKTLILDLPDHFEILRRARQRHCRTLCKISKRYKPVYGQTWFRRIWVYDVFGTTLCILLVSNNDINTNEYKQFFLPFQNIAFSQRRHGEVVTLGQTSAYNLANWNFWSDVYMQEYRHNATN